MQKIAKAGELEKNIKILIRSLRFCILATVNFDSISFSKYRYGKKAIKQGKADKHYHASKTPVLFFKYSRKNK